ncbi:Vacuolar morphogenesis protein 6 [Recurvomyces mirabilis]|uniref:Vacuolar morphogenesis protein 6 n=1 Tax=Recurvomyces mirabilis TaxID=574656 RepID=A0AAE0TNA6_9PEZI|nr:Vacuolar morphogenesis protein 6 [Recurvomyces mirabilis]KAK5158220.1 Vacuolar morphogenesis protein 6 [Recurvomyces mirabilis]
MLSAFRPEAIHELKARDKSKIESLLAYGDRLLVGLSTGSLRIYRVNEQSSPAPWTESNGEGSQAPTPATIPRSIELLREEEKFSRRPVQQLAIVKEASLLVSLSDGYINLHDLQSYAPVERIERTKGATCFTVTSNVVKDLETGVPSLVSRLAVGVKRRVLCWTWRDMEMEGQEPMALDMEASVKSLNWVQKSNMMVRLVVGMDPGFAIVDVDATVGSEGAAGEEADGVKPVFKPASRQDTASGELAGVRFGAVSSSGMGYMGMGSWVPKPMVTGLSDGHILFAKDVNTLFTDIDGRALEKRQIPWALAPEAVGYSYPFLLALQPPEKGTLQIRNPDSLTLLQTIPVPSAHILHVPQANISLAHAGKGFLVASERTIWRMNALPYDPQLGELVEKQRFDEAISLLTLLEDTLIDDKLGRIREVQIMKAISLFQQQKYQPALDLFTDAAAPPERVIALYPRSITGDLSNVPDPVTEDNGNAEIVPEGESKADESTNKEPPVTPSKGMLSKFRSTGHARKESDPASIKTAARIDSDNMSIRPLKATPTKAAPVADKPLEGEDLKLAVRWLCSFLAQARRQIQKYVGTDGSLKQDPPEMDFETGRPVGFATLLPERVYGNKSESGKASKDEIKIDYHQALLETAKLVDTTLFRAYMLALPSLAGSLFRLNNFCDPEVVQASLYENERYGDLIDFLHGKRLHRQALEMLQQFGQGEAEDEDSVPEGMRGPDRTVVYLKQLPPELVELVLEFVKWPLQVDAEKGMEVFLADTEYADRMPRKIVSEFLEGLDRKLEEEYLEHVINELGDDTRNFHQKLLELYLAHLKEVKEGDEKVKLKARLEDFLCKSNSYDEAATFRQLPADNPSFFESRAIVLSAMGNHKQALSIYVYQLKDYAKAERYCNDIYAKHLKAVRNDTTETDTNLLQHEKGLYAFEAPDRHHAHSEGDGDENVFAMLLGLYLRPPSSASEEKKWPQALDLLSRHGARLPASSTLDLMPDDLSVSELREYFVGRVRSATSALRLSSVVRGLTGVKRIGAERTLIVGVDVQDGNMAIAKKAGRNARVRIGEEDHCRVCFKRFGASAVRVLPDGSVVHYMCVGSRRLGEGLNVTSTSVGRRASGQRGWG